MIPLFCFMILPFLNGDFDSANLTYKLNDAGLAWGGFQLALVWIWIMIWSTAPEAAATFTPEYKDTVRDARKALLSSAAFILLINTWVPVALTGGAGEKIVGGSLYVDALKAIAGNGAANFFVVVILFVFFVGNIFGILAASNIGYVFANIAAIAAFVLLRKDRSLWTRTIK